jgi:predicted RND superfamily exporter protein
VELHVAGEGAIIGYLGGYVDADARRLIPFCALVITLVLIFAYRGIVPALITNGLFIATLLITMGLMAAADVPFYVITNALPVILIGISVADAIHIYLHFFDLTRQKPGSDVRTLVEETVSTMWRPITLTSLTTMAGFLGLYFSGYMPPFVYFGLYAAIGVMVAWFYTLTFLPAVMVLTSGKMGGWQSMRGRDHEPGFGDRFLGWVGEKVYDHSRPIIFVSVLIALVALAFASRLVVDENPIWVFNPGEPIVRADRVINERLSGANILDVVVETPEAEGLFLPDNLHRIEALQEFVAGLPNVGGSVSIVDYLKQMNRSLNDGSKDEYRLPDDKETVAQYFLIYSASSDPTDFEEEVDYDYRTANVRIYTKSGNYQDVKLIVESLLPYLEENFHDGDMSANLSGRVNVHYRWISELARSHFVGLGFAVLLVLTVSSLLFRSFIAGLLTMLPVAISVLLVYGLMGGTGITLGMGTSMFAAVAVGLGIDYAIHTLERMRTIYCETGFDMKATFDAYYPGTGRALFFNFITIAGGFGVLTFSKITSLNVFGAVVVLAVSASFIASVTLLPALLKVCAPAFLRDAPARSMARQVNSLLILACLLAVIGSHSTRVLSAEHGLSADEMMEQVPASEQGLLDAEMHAFPSEKVPPAMAIDNGNDLVALINAVPEGEHVTRQIDMLMTDRQAKQRSRKTMSFSKTYPDRKLTILFYLEPANIRDTGFLIWDYADQNKPDDQWLYLPALRKVRRISASDRGDYFLGTDFTYEDMKVNGKLEPSDYDFNLLGREALDGIDSYKLEAIPKSEYIAAELGYSRSVFWVNPSNWMIFRAEFWDLKGKPLKKLSVPDIRLTGGIWTRHKSILENLQTGHRTEFVISDVDYVTELPGEKFTKAALERGH